MTGPLADVDRDDFLRGVVEELKPANERWPGLWTRLESLLNERDRLERHVQDMEKALRPFVEEYDFRAADYLAQRVDGEEARVFTARTVDLLIEHQRAARAALPAREKEEE